jgi:hypothetical protein
VASGSLCGLVDRHSPTSRTRVAGTELRRKTDTRNSANSLTRTAQSMASQSGRWRASTAVGWLSCSLSHQTMWGRGRTAAVSASRGAACETGPFTRLQAPSFTPLPRRDRAARRRPCPQCPAGPRSGADRQAG